MKRRNGMTMAGAALLLACAPALDWREVRAADSGAALLFPCKPETHARRVSLAKQPVRLVLYACKAGGATWALAFADMGDPALVGAALAELREAAAQNLSASDTRALTLSVRGATPNPFSQRVEILGRMPDGRAVTEQLALFAKGTRVFQATAVGERLDAEATASFFDSLRVAP